MFHESFILFVTIFSTISNSEVCINEDETTRCRNLPPFKQGESLFYDGYKYKFEIISYKGMIPKSLFEKLQNIHGLAITNSNIFLIEDEFLNSLTKLKHFYIHDTKLPNITSGLFTQCCSSLKVLEFSKCDIKHIEPGSFEYLTNLDSLSIEYTYMEKLPKNMFTGLTSLQSLSLKGNNISIIQPGAFQDLDKLKVLNLNNNKLTTLSIEEFKKLPNLTDLYLSSNEIVEFDVKELLKYLEKLQLISFFMNKVACKDLKIITQEVSKKNIGKQIFQFECLDESMF